MYTSLNSTEPRLFVGEQGARHEDCACTDTEEGVAFLSDTTHQDNDCACPTQAITEQNTIVDTMYILSDDVEFHHLSHGFTLTYGPFMPSVPIVLNEAALTRLQSFSTPRNILADFDRELAKQRLISPVNTRFSLTRHVPSTLTVWMHVTNACNLVCPYCYVQKSSARMTMETGHTALEKIFSYASKHHIREVKLKYAGGEATTHFKLVRLLHADGIRLSALYGVALSEVLLSNGISISENDAAWLLDTGVKLMLSLDGIGDVHDYLRPYRGRKSAFASLEHTVDDVLLPLGIKPQISVTITKTNASTVADAVRWALVRNLPVSLNFYRENDLSQNHHELQIDDQCIIAGMRAAYAVFEELLPTTPFLGGLLDRVQGSLHSHTCGVGNNYLVVTHEGKLAQCHMRLADTVADDLGGDLLGSISLGIIRNLAVEDKIGCRDCGLRYRCAGGCALDTYRRTGRWDVANPNCNIYRQLFPETMRLEGLRLLKLNALA